MPFPPALSFTAVCALATAFRLALLVYGEWQDAHMQVKYTDIDYKVFTDAARFVTEGKSPYQRATYRYTPLLAFLMTPNIYVHPAYGKVVFALADLAVGVLIHRILTMRGLRPQRAVMCASLWLLNPVVASISTRGNAEAFLGLLVLGTLYLFLIKRFVAACVVYGLSVHFKLYPIIYVVPLLLLLDDEDYWGIRRKGKERAHDRWTLRHWTGMLARFVTATRIKFGLISGGTFLALNVVMYYLYSDEFLHETYLYHITRKDHRHNFSLWFYYIYLTFNQSRGVLLSLLAFVPQLWLVVISGFVFARDVFFACFVQTFIFVMYNKVCTSQYFMWYICLLPLIIPSTMVSFEHKGLLMLLAWVGGQAIWLYQAYHLEFQGENTFYAIWLASFAFFYANVWVVAELIQAHEFEPVFDLGRIRQIWDGDPRKKRLRMLQAEELELENRNGA